MARVLSRVRRRRRRGGCARRRQLQPRRQGKQDLESKSKGLVLNEPFSSSILVGSETLVLWRRTGKKLYQYPLNR